ncbi:uncharacterized protein SCHCODRAFT_01245412 [Schizophyllum commune H4-8]|uniref:uncharacterized protein n=1 Tax=Schizophyllum commune (strain H4-8 / FGSC 9210) TaxID=578458 RepID=UPI00215FF0D8|nr:uncharacterized protein SCHCODRAFT_01245412 [Schizophyllum commune H4-8]KAI5887098.1 hypothetical protein SCHCODRAFT_01245412 [Schizophyllum commune H4-8]
MRLSSVWPAPVGSLWNGPHSLSLRALILHYLLFTSSARFIEQIPHTHVQHGANNRFYWALMKVCSERATGSCRTTKITRTTVNSHSGVNQMSFFPSVTNKPQDAARGVLAGHIQSSKMGHLNSVG